MSQEKKLVFSLQNLSLTYNKRKRLFRDTTPFEALKDISFDIFEGDSVGILGRNGAGKSTLLKILVGILNPSSGKLETFGHRKSLLALNLGFDPNLSGRDNAILNGMILGFSKKEMLSKLNSICEFAELGSKFDEQIKNYSSGMKARLGFSVAINLQTDVLLIDEVLAVGDVKFKKKSKAIMEEKINSGDTVVLVSHSAQTIKKLCNKAIWIENGLVKMQGPSDLVVDEYSKFLQEET